MRLLPSICSCMLVGAVIAMAAEKKPKYDLELGPSTFVPATNLDIGGPAIIRLKDILGTNYVLSSVRTTLQTNWVSVTTLTGSKEVGVVIQNTHVRTIHNGETNDWVRESKIVRQENVREAASVTNANQFGTNYFIIPGLLRQ